MNRKTRTQTLALVAALGLTAITGPAGAASRTADPARDALDFQKSFVALWTEERFDEIHDFFATDAIAAPPNHDLLRGNEAITAFYRTSRPLLGELLGGSNRTPWSEAATSRRSWATTCSPTASASRRLRCTSDSPTAGTSARSTSSASATRGPEGRPWSPVPRPDGVPGLQPQRPGGHGCGRRPIATVATAFGGWARAVRAGAAGQGRRRRSRRGSSPPDRAGRSRRRRSPRSRRRPVRSGSRRRGRASARPAP